MNRPRYMSATTAPGMGAKFDTALQTNSILWEATLLRWYCLVRYVIMLVLSPNPATFSSISFARHPKKKGGKWHQLEGKRMHHMVAVRRHKNTKQQLPGVD
jgi:hypothetical protein